MYVWIESSYDGVEAVRLFSDLETIKTLKIKEIQEEFTKNGQFPEEYNPKGSEAELFKMYVNRVNYLLGEYLRIRNLTKKMFVNNNSINGVYKREPLDKKRKKKEDKK
jgi:hypothetical protein